MNLPYHQLPEYPISYSEHTIVSRLIDGLGYRYYWATEGLSEDDLLHRPTPEAMSSREILDHMLTLTETILNTSNAQLNIRPETPFSGTFEDLRAITLGNLKKASDIFKNDTRDLNDLKIIFSRAGKTSSFPFWHLLNGQIADALTHVGQIASYRRQSGNPQSSKVNVFTGKNRD